MDRRLLDIVLCPACGGALELAEATVVTVPYADGPREEVERGEAACACGQHYPVRDFVLSFSRQFAPALQEEAAFWDRYYGWILEQGSLGLHDLRQGLAPFLTFGVPDPFPAADTLDRYDIHQQVADHPLLRRGHTLLDMGVGLGWTSLTFARAGYAVTAFDPALGSVTAAKRYAMTQGVFIEYFCGALGMLAFRPASFDNVTAFHSLHHVPDVEATLRTVRTWMRPGGALALDEHIGNSRLAGAIGAALHGWAEEAVFSRYRTLSADALATLPAAPHSPQEDVGATQVVPVVSRLFAVQSACPRHVVLDHYPLLHYLATNRDFDAYRYSLPVTNQLQDLVRQVDPEGGDYITIIAENMGTDQEAAETGDQGPEVRDQGSAIREIAPADPIPPAIPAPEDVTLVADLAEAQQELTDLTGQYAAQAAWARSLERQLRQKEAELARLRTQVRRLENGRVMRLLRLFGGHQDGKTGRTK